MSELEFIIFQKKVLAEICQRHGVKRLEVFGSVARGECKEGSSDVDFLVEFVSYDWHGAADRWFGLQADLEKLLNRRVDLVDLTAVKSKLFLEVIEPDRRVLYAA